MKHLPNQGSIGLLFALCACTVMGCVQPPTAPMGSPVAQNGVSVTVTSATLQYLDLEGPRGGVQTDAPLFVVELDVTNSSEAATRYNLAWGATAASQEQTMLLFGAVGADADPTTGTPVARALLSTNRYLADPITEARAIAPGETVRDVLLFEAPPADVNGLTLSIPPSVFGSAAKAPAYVSIPFQAPAEVPLPAAVGQGETVAGDGFSFTVTGNSILWPRLTRETDGTAGFSDGPLLRVDFRLENTSGEPTRFLPPGASQMHFAPALTTADGTAVARAALPAGVTVDGMQASNKDLAPGETLESFFLFERPAQDVSGLRLIVPGARLGGTGLVRVDLPYQWADPAEPAELTPRVIQAPAEE